MSGLRISGFVQGTLPLKCSQAGFSGTDMELQAAHMEGFSLFFFLTRHFVSTHPRLLPPVPELTSYFQ